MNKTEFDKTIFCDKLTSLRKSRALTQKEVADAVNISDKTYSKWETGENEPDMAKLAALSDYFKVSPAVFFGVEEINETEKFVSDKLDGKSIPEIVDTAFEIQFHAVRQTAKKAFHMERKDDNVYTIPENRVHDGHSGITAYADKNVYLMMYNGDDANISLSQMPAKDNFSWLGEQSDKLSVYLGFIADPDMLRCLPHMMNASFTENYTADHLAKTAGIDAEKVAALLHRAVELGICCVKTANIGKEEVELFSTQANPMLPAILTLAHLSLPDAELNGHYCFNIPMNKVIM